jgi:hypothetical protein
MRVSFTELNKLFSDSFLRLQRQINKKLDVTLRNWIEARVYAVVSVPFIVST